jgi:antirestriction protein ArdC
MATAKKFNIYESVTEKIIEALEAGVNPWAKPWQATQYGDLRNADSNRPYRGVNTLLLGISSMVKGYFDPRWLTYKNAEKLGGNVKKGEKGTQIVFWNFMKTIDDRDPANPVEKKIPYARAYTVFNVQQCEGLKLPDLVAKVRVEGEVNEIAQKILSLPKIVHGGNKAAYVPSTDMVLMPEPTVFNTLDDYYSTGFHETIHWTGGTERLKREMNTRFGSDSYAFEELVAEIGAAFLCAAASIPFEKMQHPEYIASWLKRFKTDDKAIFTAASKAQKAADFVLQEAGILAVAEDEEVAA